MTSRINQHISGYDRHGSDFYRSPVGVVDKLVKHFPELRTGLVYEPAAGDGVLTLELIANGCKVVASDLNDWPNRPSFIQTGVNFLELDRLPDGARWIVANPPYRRPGSARTRRRSTR